MNKTSNISDQLLKLDTSDAKIEYRTGATYHGSLKEKKRSGQGVFRWPNGSCYDGDFIENKRHGNGVQDWPDGCSYVGQFKNDVRDGFGRHMWCNGEIYEGMFLMDKRHGKGTYYWPDGTKYDGCFYNDFKEGFGIFVLGDRKIFEGMYRKNERNGPGILSYQDGRQDVGIWLGEKLIKLCSVMENAFVFHHFPDYFVNAGEHLPSKIKRANSALADSRNVGSRKNVDGEGDGKDELFEISTSFPYTDILEGVRSDGYGPKGPCEVASENFLHASANGDCIRVTEILEEGIVHVNVADKTGYTALLAASVNCHNNVVNCVLDYGGDVNILNCEGLSALAACHVLFYTKHTWKHNIAETLAEENLFNSVRWDIPSGTFIQRKTRGSHSYIKYKSSEERCHNLEKVAEVTAPTTDNNTSWEEVRDSRNTEEPSTVRISRHPDCSKSSDKKKVNSMVNVEKSTRNTENNEKAGCVTELSTSENSFNVRRFIDENLNSVDKNIFINEFLSRTASAMSNQDSFLTHENMEVCMEKYCLDKRKNFIIGESNSQNFLGLNNVSDFMEKNCLKPTFFQDDLVKPLPDSIQNAFSTSIQTSGCTDHDNGSLTGVEQRRQKLLTQQRRPHLEATVRLLLKRGAHPNSSSLPMPVLFFAVKAADSTAVEILLDKGASTDARLSIQELGISPLHIAVALPSNAVIITEMFLNAGADPNIRDFAFGKNEPGRTPLHIACCREDNDEEANRLILLLLRHKANPDLLCQGNSALSLAIASGNDMAVETLLKHQADPSLTLTHGVGSALCAAVSFSAERRRKVVDRMRLVNKLIRHGANILAPIVISNEHPPGTVVDYAYCVFYQDRRIAQTPYHALTSFERDVYVARRNMLDHLADLLRTYVLKREKKLLEEQLTRVKSAIQDELTGKLKEENFDRTVSFLLGESDVKLEDTSIQSSMDKISLTEENVASFVSNEKRLPDCGLRITVVQTPSDHMTISRHSMNSSKKRQLIRKNRFRYCYDCGRSVAVRLSACTRCKEVYYCSRTCKLKAWNARHKEECVRLSGTSKANAVRRADSPTPITNANNVNNTLNRPNGVNVKQQNSSEMLLHKKSNCNQKTVAH